MKLAVMQPYFWPHLPYFQMMHLVDRWVVFDDTQFVHRGWVNRNRVLHPEELKLWQYLTVPLEKKSRDDKILDLTIASDCDWRQKMLGKLSHYKRQAPYYRSTLRFAEACLESGASNLSQFLTHTLKVTAAHLGISTPIEVQSEMDLDLAPVEHSGQWALRISQQLGASQYINPIGGKSIFQSAEFACAGVELAFLKPDYQPYAQGSRAFVPGLSIIDVLMWNDLDSVNEMLRASCHLSTSD